MKIFKHIKELFVTTHVEESLDVDVTWRFRSWFLDEHLNPELNHNQIEKFINKCSSDGFERITIENFGNRTTVWANHVSPGIQSAKGNDLTMNKYLSTIALAISIIALGVSIMAALVRFGVI